MSKIFWFTFSDFFFLLLAYFSSMLNAKAFTSKLYKTLLLQGVKYDARELMVEP